MDVSRLDGPRPSRDLNDKPLVQKLFPFLFPAKPLIDPDLVEFFYQETGFFDDCQTIRVHDLKKITGFINANKKRLFREGCRYYRREATGLPNSFQVVIPPGAKRSREMAVIVHLKATENTVVRRNVLSLNMGAEKFIKLSILLDIKQGRALFCATGTPKFASRRCNSRLSQKLLLKSAANFQHEINILERLKGLEGVIQIFGHATYPVKGQTIDKAPKVNVVFEYAQCDLLQYMNGIYANSRLDPNVAAEWEISPIRKKIIVDILTGLYNIHAKGIIHFDIKPDNILLCGSHAKITDFGFAVSTEVGLKKLRGTAIYLSPELLHCVEWRHEARRHSRTSPLCCQAMANFREAKKFIGQKSDVYSVGICLHYLKYLRHPEYILLDGAQKDASDILDSDATLPHIRSMEEWYEEFVPQDEEGRLIKRMMNPDPNQRISSKKALNRFIKIYSSL